MRTLTIAILGTFLLSLFGAPDSEAADRGSKPEARALAERASAYMVSQGRDEALAAFNKPQGDFVYKDLHVFVLRVHDGTILAHGSNTALVGKSMTGVRDSNGKAIADSVIARAKAVQTGWTDPYKFPDPLTNKLGNKQSFVIDHGDVVLGVGVFLQRAAANPAS